MENRQTVKANWGSVTNFPKRIDANRKREGECASHGADIGDQVGNRETHGHEHDAETGADPKDFGEGEVVIGLDVPGKGLGREDPPGVTEEGFERSRMCKKCIDVVEIGEVGIHLKDPIWLDEDNCSNVDQAHFPAKERLVLDP